MTNRAALSCHDKVMAQTIKKSVAESLEGMSNRMEAVGFRANICRTGESLENPYGQISDE